MNYQQVPATVHLAANFVLANLARGGDWHIQIDVSIAGVEIEIGRQVFRHFEGDGAIAAFEPPAGRQGRAGCGPRFNAAIAGLEFEFVKAAVGANVAIAGGGSQFAIDVVDFLGAISAAELHFALKVGEIDLAVAGVQVHAAFTRHLDVDIDAAVSHEDEGATRKAHVEFHRIAILMLFHENAFPNLVACARPNLPGGDSGFDRVLIPGGDADVGVGSVDAEIGLAGEGIGFRPFVGVGGQRGERGDKAGENQNCEEGAFGTHVFHRNPPPGGHTAAWAVRREYV